MTEIESARQQTLRARVETFRDAYQKHDVERMVTMFAEDGAYIAAPGVFRGRAAIRRFLRWDADLSPRAAIRDTGIGVVVHGSTVVWERELQLSARGVPYREESLAVLEFTDEGLILRLRSYYDKLAILDQITGGLTGPSGRLAHKLVAHLVDLGRKGLPLHDQEPTRLIPVRARGCAVIALPAVGDITSRDLIHQHGLQSRPAGWKGIFDRLLLRRRMR